MFMVPKSSVSIWPRICVVEFLEEPGAEVAGVVDQDVDASELGKRCIDGSPRVIAQREIEHHGQQFRVLANGEPQL